MLMREYPKSIKLGDEEKLVGAYLANRYKHIMNADGGKLYITTDRLIFEPHAFNLDTSVLEIPLPMIKQVEPFMAVIVPKGMKVTTTKQVHKFIVNDRLHIIEQIQSVLPT